MSQATKRKHVFNEILQEELTNLTEKQKIVRVFKSRGNNLHEVVAPDSTSFLVSMPNKFRKNIWVKKGDFIVVEPIEEGGKVKAEMVKVVTPEYMRYLKLENMWPNQFEEANESQTVVSDLSINTNRKNFSKESESSDSSDG